MPCNVGFSDLGRVMHKGFLLAFATMSLVAVAKPADAWTYEQTGTAVAYTMPILATGIAVSKRDWKGIVQLTVVTGLSYGTAYGLKQVIRQRRPFQPKGDHSTGWDSMPSTTSIIASAPSSFVWQRYGWEWGLPFFIVSKYSAYALSKTKKNRIWDNLASTAIAWGYNQLLTTPYRSERGLYTNLDSSPDGVYAAISYRF